MIVNLIPLRGCPCVILLLLPVSGLFKFNERGMKTNLQSDQGSSQAAAAGSFMLGLVEA